MWISARLVKVETGEILLAEQIFGERDEFFELVEKLSDQVTEAIGVELASAGRSNDGDGGGNGGQTRSLDAQLSYSQGLGLIEQEKYQEAYDKFLEALEYDPQYADAQRRADSLRPQLAAN